MHDTTKCAVTVAREAAGGGHQLAGCGVCMVVDATAFVLSAGRVLGAWPDRLWLGPSTAKVPVVAAAVIGNTPADPPDIRTLNMGFAPLMPQDAERLGAIAWTTCEDVDFEDDPPGDDYVAVSPVDADGLAWREIAARPAPRAGSEWCAVHPARPLVADVAGEVDPRRLLGCGVWRRTSEPSGALLTGIVVDVTSAADGGGTRLVATRTGLLVWSIFGFLGFPVRQARRQTRRNRRRCH